MIQSAQHNYLFIIILFLFRCSRSDKIYRQLQEEDVEEEGLVQYTVVEQVFVVVMVVVVISHRVLVEVQPLGEEEQRHVVDDFIEGVDLEEHLQPTKIHITNTRASNVYRYF